MRSPGPALPREHGSRCRPAGWPPRSGCMNRASDSFVGEDPLQPHLGCARRRAPPHRRSPSPGQPWWVPRPASGPRAGRRQRPRCPRDRARSGDRGPEFDHEPKRFLARGYAHDRVGAPLIQHRPDGIGEQPVSDRRAGSWCGPPPRRSEEDLDVSSTRRGGRRGAIRGKSLPNRLFGQGEVRMYGFRMIIHRSRSVRECTTSARCARVAEPSGHDRPHKGSREGRCVFSWRGTPGVTRLGYRLSRSVRTARDGETLRWHFLRTS